MSGVQPVIETIENDGPIMVRIKQVLNGILKGRVNCTGSVTLTANAGSTTVTALGFQSQMGIWFSAKSANAAAELGNGTMYVSAKNSATSSTQPNFVITHANNAQTDRTFDYVVFG